MATTFTKVAASSGSTRQEYWPARSRVRFLMTRSWPPSPARTTEKRSSVMCCGSSEAYRLRSQATAAVRSHSTILDALTAVQLSRTEEPTAAAVFTGCCLKGGGRVKKEGGAVMTRDMKQLTFSAPILLILAQFILLRFIVPILREHLWHWFDQIHQSLFYTDEWTRGRPAAELV